MRSIESECLDRMIFFGEDSLQREVREYVAHYHAERNHQGLDKAIIAPLPSPTRAFGRVRCRERLGGMLRTTIEKRPSFFAARLGLVARGSPRCVDRYAPMLTSVVARTIRDAEWTELRDSVDHRM